MEYVSIKKIIIFGSECVGKTSLTSRFENNFFKEEVLSMSRKYI